jgi:hypothetical protein
VKISKTKRLGVAAFALLASGVFPVIPGAGFLAAPTAWGQNIGQRVVLGEVVDSSSKPVSGATVFLKDLKTKTIRSFTSDPSGKFRFTQVDMSEDHELWAEKDGRKSAVKTVSQWDARKEFETDLRLK